MVHEPKRTAGEEKVRGAQGTCRRSAPRGQDDRPAGPVGQPTPRHRRGRAGLVVVGRRLNHGSSHSVCALKAARSAAAPRREAPRLRNGARGGRPAQALRGQLGRCPQRHRAGGTLSGAVRRLQERSTRRRLGIRRLILNTRARPPTQPTHHAHSHGLPQRARDRASLPHATPPAPSLQSWWRSSRRRRRRRWRWSPLWPPPPRQRRHWRRRS